MRTAYGVTVYFAAVACAAGCGGSSAKVVNARETAATWLSEGNAAFERRDFSAAAERLAASMDSGGLNPDAYSEAGVKLAVAYAATGQFDDAHALLDQLEAGAPNMDQVYAARSFVLKRQGKLAESRAAMAKSRQFNRTIEEF